MTTIEDRPLAVPSPTTDLDQARADLARTGLAVMADVLQGEQLALVREVLYRTARTDRERGRFPAYEGDGVAHPFQWVPNLPSRDPVFLDLVEHPLALTFVREVLGWPALLSNISAIITGPGNEPQPLHADMSYMPEPWGGIQGINIVWCVDDFTDDVGATRIVPGSHLRNTKPRAADQDVETVPLEAPAGSMIAMEGRVWHGTGRNTSADRTRAGIFSWFTLPIYLPQENWWLTLDQSIRKYGSDELKVLFGYKVMAGFGLQFGASPE